MHLVFKSILLINLTGLITNYLFLLDIIQWAPGIFYNMFVVYIVAPFFIIFLLVLLISKKIRQRYLKMWWQYLLLNFVPLITVQIVYTFFVK
jgi:hypothetical protein